MKDRIIAWLLRRLGKVCMDQHKDWKFQEQDAMDNTAAIQRFLTTYRVGGESGQSVETNGEACG